MARILVINGHPDPSAERLSAALSAAYAKGAKADGHDVRRIVVGDLGFPLLRAADEFENESPPPCIAAAQRDIAWADHLVVVFPLWLGGLPALTKGFFEQVFRPRFAMRWKTKNPMPEGLLKGTSVRLIVTMGMPAAVYRLAFGATGVRSFETSVLRLAGLHITGRTLIGGAGALSAAAARGWLKKVALLAGKDV